MKKLTFPLLLVMLLTTVSLSAQYKLPKLDYGYADLEYGTPYY